MYGDLNNHDELCRDPLLELLSDRDDLTREFRRLAPNRGQTLASKCTLNRLERTPLEGTERAELTRFSPKFQTQRQDNSLIIKG